MRSDDREEGMMLTEVLVALAILSLVSLAMFRVFSGTSEAIRVQRDMAARVDLAQDLLARTAQSGMARPGVATGEANGLKWRIELRAVDVDPVAPNQPAALAVRISVGDLGGPPLLSSAVIGAANAP
jgi:type II secretory pathway component PulJ